MKRYNLKPGRHQFAPGSAAVHSNDNLTDAAAEWYLERYPHIAQLFTPQPPEGGIEIQEAKIKIRRKRKFEIENPKSEIK